MEQKLELKFQSLPKYSSDVVYFLESGFDKKVNDAIVSHIAEIRELFADSERKFVYFPLLLEDDLGAVEYNYPNVDMSKMDGKASSDILLSLLADERRGMEVPPCIGCYSCTDDDGAALMDVYPVTLQSGDDIMSILGEVLEKMDEEEDDGVLYSKFGDFECDVDFSPKGIRDSSDVEKKPLDADETFDEDVKSLMEEVQEKVAMLRLHGVSEWVLKKYLFPQKKLSRLVITEKYEVVLPDYKDMVIKMEPLVKAIYILFLRHEEGIIFKHLPDYREELYDIYVAIRSCQDKPSPQSEKRIRQSIESVTNPLSNSINEKCARVRAAFVSQFDESISSAYYIDGNRGEAKRIALDRSLVEWR